MDDPVQKGLPPPDRGIRPVGLGEAQEPIPVIDGVTRLDPARVLDMLSLGEAGASRSPPPAGSKKLSVLSPTTPLELLLLPPSPEPSPLKKASFKTAEPEKLISAA